MKQQACHECGSLFSPDKAGRKYCSPSCYSLARRGQKRGPYRGHEAEQRRCVVCDRPFLVGGRGRPSRRTTRCSAECARRGRYRRGQKSAVLTTAQAAYLAGFVDGEGSIMLVGRAHERSAVHLRLSVANTHMGVLEWIAQTTGLGRIYQQREASATHRRSFAWRIHGDGADSVLSQIGPFLIVKAEQAALALSVMQRLRIPKDKADLSWQVECQERMRSMNRRGGDV